MESTGLLLFWTVGSECRPLGEPLGGPGLVDSNRQPLSATLESHIHPCLPLLFPVSLLSSAFLPSLLPSSSFFPLSFFSPLLRFVPHRPCPSGLVALCLLAVSCPATLWPSFYGRWVKGFIPSAASLATKIASGRTGYRRPLALRAWRLYAWTDISVWSYGPGVFFRVQALS